MKKGISQLISIVLIAAIAFACGFGGSVAKDYLIAKNVISLPGIEAAPGQTVSEAPLPVTGTQNPVTINITEDSTMAEAIASKVLPSVVGISTVYEATYSSGFGGDSYSYDVEGVGTGFIVDKGGYIVTNAHVVNDGDAKTITISLFDGDEVPGAVLWSNSTLDLAVVKIEKAKDLVAVELGDSEDLNVGSYAAAIGNPLGLAFERSMSQGIISGLNRTITVSGGSSGAVTMEGLIQTDATINSGNSGGPLLNSKGQVVGVNSARANDGEGMGFAIPINVVKPIVEQIITTGAYNRPYIGITGIGLEEQSSYTQDQLEEYFGTATGVYVYSVTRGGGADKAGIKKGDIIVEIDGTRVGTMNKINTVLVGYNPGDTIRVKLMRDMKYRYYDITLTSDKDIVM